MVLTDKLTEGKRNATHPNKSIIKMELGIRKLIEKWLITRNQNFKIRLNEMHGIYPKNLQNDFCVSLLTLRSTKIQSNRNWRTMRHVK